MGFLKDLNTVTKMGKDMQRRTDVSASLAQAQAAMAQANATMAAMATRASSGAAVSGTPGTATVISARQTGQYVNMQPIVELELLVQAPGRVPTPVSVTEIVEQIHLARVAPGASLAVKVGQIPTDLFIDWSRP